VDLPKKAKRAPSARVWNQEFFFSYPDLPEKAKQASGGPGLKSEFTSITTQP